MLFLRFLLACGFCFGGVEFVYWNMRLNGSSYAANPAWRLVSQIHDIFVTIAMLGAFAAVALATIYFVSAIRPYCAPKQKCEAKAIDPEVLAEERRKEEEDRLQREEQRKRDEELRKQAEIERRKYLEELRKKQTADDVTRSALQDFL